MGNYIALYNHINVMEIKLDEKPFVKAAPVRIEYIYGGELVSLYRFYIT